MSAPPALVSPRPAAPGGTALTAGPVSFPGLSDAVAVQYDNAPPSPLHGLVVVAKGPGGELGNVTALAPRALFASLDLMGAVASLRVTGTSGWGRCGPDAGRATRPPP